MLKKSVFTIGNYQKAYIGYTSGRLWNGWATPFFDKTEADKVAEGFNEFAEFPMQYDEVYDQFYILDTETDELEKWEGTDYPTTDGIKHLYGIGAYSWVWDEEEIEPITEGIVDLFFYYEHEIAEEFIAEQLKDFNKLRSVIEILRADEIAEIKMQKLREELIIMKRGQIIAVNGSLYEYGGIEEAEYSNGLMLHEAYVVDVDEEGILTSTGITCHFTTEELANNEIHFTKPQWYGIVELFIRRDYDLTEEEISDAVEDIVGREFAYGRPKTLEELSKQIVAHINR